MQTTTGVKAILSWPWVYRLFKAVIGADRGSRFVAREFWRAKPGDKVVDIGCGPGTALDYLPREVRYVGFDISEEYVRHARARHADVPDRTFLVGDPGEFVTSPPAGMLGADLVIVNGVLHHLDDAQAETALALARACMAPGGRLVCLENALLMSQAPIANWLVRQDRGRNLRYEGEWKTLFARVFEDYETHIMTGLLNIPYTHILVEARLRRG